MMERPVHHHRRKSLIERIRNRGGGIAIIPTSNEAIRNGDVPFSFRPDSNFHYLTNFNEPEAVLVIVVGESSQCTLFCRDKNIEQEIWEGFHFGPAAAREKFLLDAAYSITEFESRLGEMMPGQPAVWYPTGRDPVWDARVSSALSAVRAQARNGQHAPGTIQDVTAELSAMRLIKDDVEIATMRQAARISAAAHARAMRVCRPGLNECEVEAELLHEFRRMGCDAPAYPSIVAGGENTCVLHYAANDKTLRDGDLLLIDAGGEFQGYASDITRTFPVNGKFSGPQVEVYTIVLEAQHAAIASIEPGADFMTPHLAATRVLAQGMLDLGLLNGSLDGVLESGSYKQFYMHRTSHWLGRDVHDVGAYKVGNDWRLLEAGMVLTVEPGFYIRPAEHVDEKYWNIGVRIEDDVAVTVTGSDVLSKDAPKQIVEIEALMRG